VPRLLPNLIAADRFEAYYRAQRIVPPAEWSTFISTLHRPLPTTFRLCAAAVHQQLVAECIASGEALLRGGDSLPPARELRWCRGWQLDGLSKDDLKASREPALCAMQKWLSHYSSLGVLTRQAIESMVPVALLDPAPSHAVLDMCASPGSKTTQARRAQPPPLPPLRLRLPRVHLTPRAHFGLRLSRSVAPRPSRRSGHGASRRHEASSSPTTRAARAVRCSSAAVPPWASCAHASSSRSTRRSSCRSPRRREPRPPARRATRTVSSIESSATCRARGTAPRARSAADAHVLAVCPPHAHRETSPHLVHVAEPVGMAPLVRRVRARTAQPPVADRDARRRPPRAGRRHVLLDVLAQPGACPPSVLLLFVAVA